MRQIAVFLLLSLLIVACSPEDMVGSAARTTQTAESLPVLYYSFEDVTNGIVTDSSGNGSFSVTLPTVVPIGHFIAATATDPAGSTSLK